jgi:hypothetical protein
MVHVRDRQGAKLHTLTHSNLLALGQYWSFPFCQSSGLPETYSFINYLVFSFLSLFNSFVHSYYLLCHRTFYLDLTPSFYSLSFSLPHTHTHTHTNPSLYLLSPISFSCLSFFPFFFYFCLSFFFILFDPSTVGSIVDYFSLMLKLEKPVLSPRNSSLIFGFFSTLKTKNEYFIINNF